MRDYKILDCTFRDGGYVNDWKWGYRKAVDIIQMLNKAKVDIIEVGFLRNVDGYDEDITVCNKIEELNRLLPEISMPGVMYSAMAMRSNYDINKLSPYSGDGIELIRITAHDYDIWDGMDFARAVMDKGYKVSINPINIMGYSDEELIRIIGEVNKVHPYQFSIVDTFGSMRRRDLDRIVSIVDNDLLPDIRLGLHLHENMALSFSLAQNFLDKHINRDVTIDGSLVGMGREPGNLPIELLADYMNEYFDKHYDIDYLMNAIQDYIYSQKGETKWGYTPAYFLSAKFNLHRNYAEHFLKKGDLTHRDINHLLSRIDDSKKTVFDAEYADSLYYEYMDNRIDDSEARNAIKGAIGDSPVLILAPGASINTHLIEIQRYISDNHPFCVSVNFIPSSTNVDYAFFSNNKRYDKINSRKTRLIVTSNIREGNHDYMVDYNSISGAFEQGCNSMIMLLNLLSQIGIKKIALAGADGYVQNASNYSVQTIQESDAHDSKYNLAVKNAMQEIGVQYVFITPSAYE